jgi:hypothetical protein
MILVFNFKELNFYRKFIIILKFPFFIFSSKFPRFQKKTCVQFYFVPVILNSSGGNKSIHAFLRKILPPFHMYLGISIWTSGPEQLTVCIGTIDHLFKKFTSRPQKLNIGTRQPYHSSVHTILYVYTYNFICIHIILFSIHTIYYV